MTVAVESPLSAEERPTNVEPAAASDPKQRRFTTIDALRGLAAFAVVFYHFNGPLKTANPGWAPSFIRVLMSRGYLGVDVFFIISGFVIAHSIRDGIYTWGYLGRFAARRSIRLDPPYWLTIAMETALIALTIRLFPSMKTPMPTVPQIASHLVYLQDILRQGNVLAIFWTLCYEVQFYFSLVTMLVLWQTIKPHVGSTMKRVGPHVFFALLFAWSIAVRYSVVHNVAHGIALDRWFQFFCGMLTYWTVRGRTSAREWTAAMLFLLAVVVTTRQPVEQYLALFVSVFLMLSAKTGFLEKALARPTFQFFGKISYSVYLLHLVVGARFISLVRTLNHGTLSIPAAWLTLVAALILTTASSTMMWWSIESPTTRLSKRIRMNTTKTSSE